MSLKLFITDLVLWELILVFEEPKIMNASSETDCQGIWEKFGEQSGTNIRKNER